MSLERASGATSLLDVLDRVLDKGIVVDAWVHVSLVEIDRIAVEARVPVITATDLNATPPPENSPRSGKFGSAASSHSALRIDDGDVAGGGRQ